MKFLKLLGHTCVILSLTVITQVGGIVWLLSVFVSKKMKTKKRYTFPLLYLVFNLLVVPPIAKIFGREKLPIFSSELKPRNIAYPLLFRNYVTPELSNLLITSATDLKFSNISITYLDANFPFFNGFPLLPHLSHNDGKKIDISFQYLDNIGMPTNKKPSVSGYGVYVNSINQTSEKCKYEGYWQYDFPKYLSFGKINELTLDEKNTRTLVLEFVNNSNTQKIFIEPYLKQQLQLQNYSKIRFHGCQAVRHDDHIHLQIN